MGNEFDYSQREPKDRKTFEDNYKAWLEKIKANKEGDNDAVSDKDDM